MMTKTPLRNNLIKMRISLALSSSTLMVNQQLTMILHPVSDQKLDCGKAWEQGTNAGNVSVDHFQYHKGTGDSSDIFTHTQNTIMHNYVAKL